MSSPSISPSSFPYGSLFAASTWQKNICYSRPLSVSVYASDIVPGQRNIDLDNKGCYSPCTVDVKVPYFERGVVDLSSQQQIGDEKCALVYHMKGPGESMQISFVCAFATVGLELPLGIVYHALRIVFSIVYFVIATPIELVRCKESELSKTFWKNFDDLTGRLENSLWHIVVGPFFAIATVFAHALVIVESIFTGFVQSDPLNARKLVAYINRLWNDNRPLAESWWSVAGPQGKFKWLADYHPFYFPGCYQPMAVAVLNEAGTQVIAIKSFGNRKIADITSAPTPYNPCSCYCTKYC